jgi:octaprenyl-diphosphate synthase
MPQSVVNGKTGLLNGGWRDPIAADLELVEAALRSAVDSSVPRLIEAATNLLEAGGKRLRPSLVLLWAKACGEAEDPERAISIASAAELVHMATLMHDDVIDKSDVRRGRRTANASWGNKLSVLTGDYILSKAFEILVANGDIEIMRILAGVTTGMTESEALQAVNEGSIEGWRENYWRIIKGKTADFMSSCCEVGAVLAGARDAERKAAVEYGANLGLAFQITDDLLDLIGRPDSTGKPVGGDLKDGKVTLPILLMLDMCSEEDRARIGEMIASRKISDEDVQYVRRVAEAVGAIGKTRSLASDHSASAVGALSEFADTPAVNSLRALAEQVIRRQG